MDDQLSLLNMEDDEPLKVRDKIRLTLEHKKGQDFQKFISRQTDALTLLLTACNW